MPEANAPSRWNARLTLWLACAWVAAGALFKLFSGSPNDLPGTVRDFPLLRPEWTFKLAIGVELSIVILALAHPRVGWVLLALLFAFFDFLLWQMMQAGEQSCGCFGSRVPLAPWHMMAIDTVLLVVLLASRPWSAFPRRPRKPPLLLLFLLLAIAVVLAFPWFYIKDTKITRTINPATGEEETIFEAGEFVLFKPASWEGQILADTDLAACFVDGADMAYTIPAPAHVVLYRYSCDHCRMHFERLMAEPVDRPVVLIEIPEDTDAADVVTPVKPIDAMEFQLVPRPRGYGITTPVIFDLDENWTIQNVVERPVEDGDEGR